jgi:hypothetical protein
MFKRPAHFALAGLAALALHAQLPVVMNRYDQARTSADPFEATLNISNVNQAGFGKLYSYYVDGSVFAQPLYLPGIAIPGAGTHNVLYVATMNDKVYAFDADKPGPPLWMRSFTDEMAGITPVPITDITNDAELNLVGNIGIESTPAIDREGNAIFLVARTRENGKYVQRLHKLDVRDGKDLVRGVVIDAALPGTSEDAVAGTLRFDAKTGNQRAALALLNGAVIVAWGSHEDIDPYHGWVMAYDGKTLRQRAAWCVTPDGSEGGVWQSGRGPAIDEAGNMYFETGNGDWDGRRNFGTSLVKLKLAGDALQLIDYFTPNDFKELNRRDFDLGSTGPMLVPGTNLLITGSKGGAVYVLDIGKLGHMTPEADAVLQKIVVDSGRIKPGTALWDGSAGRIVYLWGETGFLKAFRLGEHGLETPPFAQGNIPSHGSPGGSLTISSNGKQSGTGIVWATHTKNKSAGHGNALGVLSAFDAETLHELWNSEQRQNRDRLGTLMKFVSPLVVAGKVYIPNYDNAVNVYGLLSR